MNIESTHYACVMTWQVFDWCAGDAARHTSLTDQAIALRRLERRQLWDAGDDDEQTNRVSEAIDKQWEHLLDQAYALPVHSLDRARVLAVAAARDIPSEEWAQPHGLLIATVLAAAGMHPADFAV